MSKKINTTFVKFNSTDRGYKLEPGGPCLRLPFAMVRYPKSIHPSILHLSPKFKFSIEQFLILLG